MTTEETSKKTIVEEKSKTESVPPAIATMKKMRGNKSVWRVIASTWMSRKLWMTVFSTLIIYGTYWHTIYHLYSMNSPEQVGALSTMYIAMLSVLGVIVAAYLGTNAISSKFNVTSAAQILSQTLTEDRNENINETINQNIDENSNRKEEIIQTMNYKEYIVEEGVNTDEPRPYSRMAVTEE